MLKIGITGGIGSGKTTVCKIFELLHIPVYYADERAKQLMIEDKDLITRIQEVFGEAAYHTNGTLNRAHLAAEAFSDAEKLAQLNAIVHPAVAKDGAKWQTLQEKNGVLYTLKEAALLFESGSHQRLDKIITVFAPKILRIERVLQRDQTNKVAIEARMNKQMPEAEKLELTHFIINNNGEQLLLPQIINIHQTLISLTKSM